MNTSSYPSSSTPSQGPSKDNRGLIYGILIAALLGTWGYIIYDKSRTKEVFEQKDQQYASLDSSKTSIQKEYEEALLRLDGMTSTNASLDSLVKTKDSELAGLKGRISTLVKKQNASAEDLREARTLISQLNGKIDGYLQEIERLQGENQQLTEDKRNLSNEKSRLEGDLSSTRSEKKAADDLIDIGSTLSASNFQIAAVDVKGSGKEKSTNTAKKADKFRISFDLAENRIAQSGSKELYVVVMDPAGKVVQEQGLGSGTFRTREDGDRQYTNKVSVNYSQGERKNVSFDLQQADKYVPGNYKVDVYHNGFRIGGGTVNLKKAGLFN
jgi:predicted nuclease with TOPRIM domain